MSNGYCIVINEDELRRRTRAVQNLLRTLARNAVPCQFARGLYNGGKVIAAHDGNNLQEHYRAWKFRTINPKVWCSYHELWKPISGKQDWFLYQSYLSLFMHAEDFHLKEIICLHCDPQEEQNRFKKGPHLHIVAAEHPISRSHFPLNYSHLDEILSDCHSLMDAIGNGVQILRNEVVEKYPNNPGLRP